MAVLILTEESRLALKELREIAAANPVDMPPLMDRLLTVDGKRAHMDQMTAQSVDIPVGFLVTFSIELRHPAGTCRHMSMSTATKDRTPTPEAVWMIAEELGFNAGLHACRVWLEDLKRGEGRAVAINVVQPVSVQPTGKSVS